MLKFILALAATVALLAPARATPMDDARNCQNAPPDIRIAACSALLHNPRLGKASLPSVYFDRANAYSDKSSVSLAIADYGTAIGLKPDFAEAYLNRGAVKEKTGDLDGAIADYSSVITLKPDDLQATLDRAIARGERHDYRGALADFSSAARLSPQASEGPSGLCWIHAVSGIEPEKAVEPCNRAVALRPSDTATLGYRALVSVRLGDFDDAIVDYDRALAASPKNATLLFGRGLAKLRTGNPTGANEDFGAAKSLDPRITQTYADYGIAP